MLRGTPRRRLLLFLLLLIGLLLREARRRSRLASVVQRLRNRAVLRLSSTPPAAPAAAASPSSEASSPPRSDADAPPPPSSSSPALPAGSPDEERRRDAAGRYLNSALRLRWARRWVKVGATALLERQVEGGLDRFAEYARGRLKDDAMPQVLQRAIDTTMDTLMPSIKQECWRGLDERFLPARLTSPSTSLSPLVPLYARHRARVGGGDAPRRRWAHWPLQRLRRLRAFLLHALWPHDRSVWQRARAPTWWALQAVGVLPWGVGAGWWLLLSLAADLRDEYQLCTFIVGLRVSQFLTLGVAGALNGCWLAYRCSVAAAHAAHAAGFGADAAGAANAAAGGCIALSPQLSAWGGAWWVVQAWVACRAFALLPRSSKKGQRVQVERRSRLSLASRFALAAGEPIPSGDAGSGADDDDTADDAAADDVAAPAAAAPAAATARHRGGVLLPLGRLDLALALLAVGLAVLGWFALPRAALAPSLYWLRTAHALAGGPYLLFKIPLLETLLTNARPTGYDAFGHTMPKKERKGDAHTD